MKRRDFVGSALAGGAVLIGGRLAGASQSRLADTRVEVLAGEPIGRIAPEIYGHFVEHLGGVVYDGIWVGENSRIPNTGGIRQALIDAMKRIKPGVIRWPGGCFADSYNWRDGIEARSKRPKRPNFWVDAREWPQGVPDGPWKYDTNNFGTDEFLRFCELSGGKPYLAANLRSLTARDFYEWVDYCNSPTGTTTLAEMRATAGRKDPWNVRFWGIGNESWGCGGNFTPEEYAQEFRRFAEWVPRYNVDLAYIGSGPNAGDLGWTRRFFGRLAEKGGFGRLWGWGLHHYSWNVTGGRTTDWWQGKGDAVKYGNDEWYELLSEANRVEDLITDHWAVMGEFDRQRRVKLVVDEWGAWYKPGSEVNNTHLLGQQSTMRDAVLAGLSLDIFHNHADKVAMANIAQLINCLQSLFLAHEDNFILTPTYHVFDMYSAHQGAQAVRTQISASRLSYSRNGKPATMRGVGGSASVREKQLVVTLTNADPMSPRDCEIGIKGASAKDVRVTVLGSNDIHDHNSFSNPRIIEPKAGSATIRPDGTLTCSMAAASIMKLEVTLS